MAQTLRDTVRQIALLDWSQTNFAAAARLAPALVIVLVAGLVAHQPAAGAIACGGALTVGFGTFQQFTRSRAGPMLFAAIGVVASTVLGTLAGNGDVTMALAALVYGFWCGLLPAIGMGAFWIGQQCTIFLIVAGAYAGGLDQAMARAVLVLAGAVAQIACYGAISVLGGGRRAPGLRAVLADARTALSGLALHIRLRSPYFRFALRFAGVLVAAVAIEQRLAVPNGYWVAMTSLLLMRPDFQDVLLRSLGRIIGTIAGAATAALIGHVVGPGAPVLALLATGFAVLAIACLRLNYGVFSFFISGYVCFLLALAGLGETRVAETRILATLLGGCFALAAHLDFYLLRRRVRRRNPAAPE